MNVTGIIIAAAVVGIVGIVIGVLLGIASEKFKVEVDEREDGWSAQSFPEITAAAAATRAATPWPRPSPPGRRRSTQCPVGGAPVGEQHRRHHGRRSVLRRARSGWPLSSVSGTCDKAKVQYQYAGIEGLQSKASVVPGAGPKACSAGCLGSGTCVKACAV